MYKESRKKSRALLRTRLLYSLFVPAVVSADIRFLIISEAKKPPERICGIICTANRFASLREDFTEKCVERQTPNYY